MSAELSRLLERPDIWRGNQAHAPVAPVVPSGNAELDALLPGGGWPLGVVIELCCAQQGLGEVSLVLPALARLAADSRWIAMVAPPYPLYAPALAAAGIALKRCLVVDATSTTQALWSAEQVLRSGACAGVLLWSSERDGNALRRLQLAAESGRALCVLYRPYEAARHTSPAAVRLRVDRGPSLQLFKCRGSAIANGRTQAIGYHHAVARHPFSRPGAGSRG
jgi:hypothetical protein